MWGDEIYIGKFLQVHRAALDEEEPVLDDGTPISRAPLAVTEEQSERIIKRMM